MKNQIKVAFIIRNSKELDGLKNLLLTNQIQANFFSLPKEIVNTEFYDIILIHESFLTEFERGNYPDSEVIVLSDSKNKVADLYPKLQNLAVFTIIQWPTESLEICKYITQAYTALIDRKKTSLTQENNGKSIVVTSFSNGVGKTLVSYNLALKLTKFFQSDTVSLVDMNIPFSTARSMLNLQDTYNWHSIRPILLEGIAPKQKIQNVMYSTQYNFSLLSGPTDFENNLPLTKKEFHHLLQSMVKLYRASIIDWHTITLKEDFAYIAQADLVLVVVDMTSNSILQTMRGVSYLREHEPELLSDVKFIFNRVDEKHGKTPELVETKLEIQPFCNIDEDSDAVNMILENGELLNDKSLLIDSQLYNLAEKIVKTIF